MGDINKFIYLREVHPCLREMFHKLCISERMTLRPISNKENIIDSMLSDHLFTYAFKLLIPYAISKTLKWDVIFNPHDLTCAPDFYFNDIHFDEYLQEFHSEDLNKYVPGWFNWDIKNTESLEFVVRGFIVLYKKFQENKLCMAKSFLSEEYRSIASLENYTSNHIELYVEEDSAEFLVALHLRISRLPDYKQLEDGEISAFGQKDYALLGFLFHDKEGKSKASQLLFSIKLEHFLGKRKNLNNPPYTEPIVQYIPFVTSLLQKHINEMVFYYQFRKEYVATLVTLKLKSILEYDSCCFNYVIFLCELYGIYIHVFIHIGDDFPIEDSQVKIIIAHPVDSTDHHMNFGLKQTSQRDPYGMAISFLDQLKIFVTDQLRTYAK